MGAPLGTTKGLLAGSTEGAGCVGVGVGAGAAGEGPVPLGTELSVLMGSYAECAKTNDKRGCGQNADAGG